jgi:hypothetical protein
LANRTAGLPLLEGVDDSCIFEEPSALEQTYAIFANVLEFDASGAVHLDGWSKLRSRSSTLPNAPSSGGA